MGQVRVTGPEGLAVVHETDHSGLTRVSLALAAARDYGAIAAALFDAAEDLGAVGVGLVLIAEDWRRTEFVASRGYPSAYRAAWSRFTQAHASPLTDAIAGREIRVLGSGGELAAQYPHLATDGSERFAVLALPLEADDQVLGGMSLRFDGPIPSRALPTGVYVSRLAAESAANVRSMQDLSSRIAQLQSALSSRVLIEQAKGLVAGTSNVSVHEAFERIRAYARSQRKELQEVATDLIRGHLDPALVPRVSHRRQPRHRPRPN